VKNIEVIRAFIESIPKKNRKIAQKAFLEMIPEERNTVKLMESQFMRFFTSYSMYFNKRHCRDGNLFYRRFKRVEIERLGHLQSVVYYIHANPVKHKIKKVLSNYEWSSFLLFLSNERTFLAKDGVFEWFGGKDKFLEYHNSEKKADDEGWLFIE
jgi:hypothetical protein